MSARVLCVLAAGFEEIETITPVDLWRRAGVEVVMASLEAGPVTGRCGVTVVADAVLGDVMGGVFDLLLLPGGPGVGVMRGDGRVGELVRGFVEAGKPVAAICAAPLVLMDAGVLDGRRFTAHDSTAGELPGSSGERVEEDGGVITSRGAGTAMDFGFLLVRKLAGAEVEEEIRRAILA
jgi:4-methyl-5(b-hydroxyethyl)-thiazole monophosphate biosynthesis